MIDISVDGIGFRSHESQEIGGLIHANIENMILVECKIMNCIMYESNSDFMEYEYRVGCKYTHPDYGKQIIVKMHQLGYLEPKRK